MECGRHLLFPGYLNFTTQIRLRSFCREPKRGTAHTRLRYHNKRSQWGHIGWIQSESGTWRDYNQQRLIIRPKTSARHPQDWQAACSFVLRAFLIWNSYRKSDAIRLWLVGSPASQGTLQNHPQFENTGPETISEECFTLQFVCWVKCSSHWKNVCFTLCKK